MESATKKRPHPLRLTFILCVFALLCYPIIKNPFLFAPAVFLTLVSVTAFLVIRTVLKMLYPEKFKKKEVHDGSSSSS